MLRGYRGIIVALAGLVLIGTSESPKRDTQTEQAQTDKTPSKGKANTSNSPAESTERIGSSKEGEPCGQARYQGNDDLCAQWKAADAARDAADWAWWQLGLSALGVLGLGLTLWFNFRALRIAEGSKSDTIAALEIARQNADAAARTARWAREANAISREASRPWLDFNVGDNGMMVIKHEQTEWYISAYVSIYGNRPAIKVTGRIEAFLDGPPDNLLKAGINAHDVPREDEHWITVFPGSEKIELALSGRTDIAEGTRAKITAIISLRYFDSVGGEPKFTARSFDLTPTDAGLKFYGMDGEKTKFDSRPNNETRAKFVLHETHHVAGVAA